MLHFFLHIPNSSTVTTQLQTNTVKSCPPLTPPPQKKYKVHQGLEVDNIILNPKVWVVLFWWLKKKRAIVLQKYRWTETFWMNTHYLRQYHTLQKFMIFMNFSTIPASTIQRMEIYVKWVIQWQIKNLKKHY